MPKKDAIKSKSHEGYPHAVNVEENKTFVIVGKKESGGEAHSSDHRNKEYSWASKNVKNTKKVSIKKSRTLTSKQVEREDITPVQKASYSQHSLNLIGKIMNINTYFLNTVTNQ